MYEIHEAGHNWTEPTGRTAENKEDAIAQAHAFVIEQSKAHCGWKGVAVKVGGRIVYMESAYRGETFHIDA